MAWISSGRLTNPAAAQVLVDTGALAAGSRIFQAWLASTVQFAAEIQHVDAAGTGVLKSQIIAVPAYGFEALPTLAYPMDMGANERIRVVAVTAATGSVSCSIDVV